MLWHKALVAPGFLARRVAPELQLARLSEGDEKLEELWVEVPVEMDIGIHRNTSEYIRYVESVGTLRIKQVHRRNY